jgi:F0F1-type ATP synthase delta subunit
MTTEKEISIWVKSLQLILDNSDQEKIIWAAKKLQEILRKKKKAYLLPKIVQRLEKSLARKNQVELVLAKDHSPETILNLEKKLAAIFGQGKSFDVKINSELIGGFSAKSDRLLVLATVKDFLAEIKNNCLLSG